MPQKGGHLTPGEKIFVAQYAKHGDRNMAAKKAGYAAPSVSASQALSRPVIRHEILRIQQELLVNEVLPLAIKTHMEILKDPKAPAGARVQAVKLAYDRVLGAQDEGAKPIHEMTGDEIAAALHRLQSESSNRAIPIIDAMPAGGLFD